ncbi:MAG: hypothetical protein ABWX84_11445, partial [Nocardioides sp.]
TLPGLPCTRHISSAAEGGDIMRKELTFADLDGERVELLPARETLFVFGNANWANVYASNSSLAFNAGSAFSIAHSSANQAVIVSQG